VTREILTPRLRIRDWKLSDLDRLAEIFADPRVWQFPFGRGLDVEETNVFLTGKIEGQDSASVSPSAVEELESGLIIGYVSLAPPDWLPEVLPAVEIGWRLDPAHWRRGLATEGGRALLAYGFEEMGLGKILSIYEPENVASGRVMTRLGMHFDHETRHPWFGRMLHVYSLSRVEWERALEA
jgi:RimJ/RimL family protein N-acetyltransferase